MRIIIEILDDIGELKLTRQYSVENGIVQDLQEEIQAMVDTVIAEGNTKPLI